MTDDRQLSAVLETWLAEGPIQIPDRVFDNVADRIGQTRQRPAWRLDWRLLDMNLSLKIGMATAAVVLMAIVGYNLLPGGSSGIGGPAPTAVPTVSPTVTATPTPTEAPRLLVEGTLPAGTYFTDPFVGAAARMTVSFAVPDGWEGVPNWAVLGPRGTGEPDGIGFGFSQPAGVFADPCHWDRAGTGSLDQPAETVVGPTVDDLVAALRANTSYVSAAPVDVVVGGYPGKQVDIELPSDVDFSKCDKLAGDTIGTYWVFTPLAGTESQGAYAQGRGNRWHIRILDIAGSRVVIVVDDYTGTPAQDQAAAQAMVNSIQFTP